MQFRAASGSTFPEQRNCVALSHFEADHGAVERLGLEHGRHDGRRCIPAANIFARITTYTASGQTP